MSLQVKRVWGSQKLTHIHVAERLHSKAESLPAIGACFFLAQGDKKEVTSELQGQIKKRTYFNQVTRSHSGQLWVGVLSYQWMS